jgi:protein-disulfide isomerase-like protein with CxxC motif
MADAADVTGVAWEAARAADDTDNQRMLERIQRRHRSERRALEDTTRAARGPLPSAELGAAWARPSHS